MPIVHASGTLPTHALAVLDSACQPSGTTTVLSRGRDTLSSTQAHSQSPLSPSPSPDAHRAFEPYLIPIDAESFFLSFGHNTARTLGTAVLTSKWSKAPSPRIRADRATGARFITLPVIPIYVPHLPSLPHLLLFAQGISIPTTIDPDDPLSPHSPSQTDSDAPGSSASVLATYLLPLAAIEEFPSAPTMAAAMARQCTAEELAAHTAFNEGIWRNILALSPADATLVDLVRVARNVTSDAMRLKRQRETSVRVSAPPTRHPPALRALKKRTPNNATDVNDREQAKAPDASAPLSPPRTVVQVEVLSQRLPVVEVDYPVDFLVKLADQRAIPARVGESSGKRQSSSVQCFVPGSPLERRGSPAMWS